MRRTTAVVGSVLFFVVAPGVVTGLIPWWVTRWIFQAPFLALEPTRVLGAALIGIGVVELVDSFVRFALEGLGTPAPIAPTRHLVVTGLYRYVRNPMYLAVVAIIFGQAVLLGDWRLIGYGALVWFACHLFVVGYEEPKLRQMFGTEYQVFHANVPRWVPRLI